MCEEAPGAVERYHSFKRLIGRRWGGCDVGEHVFSPGMLAWTLLDRCRLPLLARTPPCCCRAAEAADEAQLLGYSVCEGDRGEALVYRCG